MHVDLRGAAAAIQQGNLKGAYEVCQQALALDPANAEALSLMGIIAGQMGRHDVAADMMGSALSIRPADDHYRRNYLTALISLERIEDARVCVVEGLRRNPHSAEMLSLKGVIDSRLGDFDAALVAVQKAADIRPDVPQIQYNLGELYRRKDDTDKALACFKRCLEMEPNHADAVNNLAGVLLNSGEFIESLRYLQKYLELQPRSAQGYANLSVAMCAAGDVQQALVCLRNALAIDPSLNETRFKLVNLLTSAGDFAEATQLLDEWEAREPGDARLLSVRARMLERQGRIEEARAAYERINESERHLSAVRITEATLLDVEGKPAEAAKILESVIENSDADALDLVGIRFSLGKHYDAIGEHDKAFDCYSQANAGRRKGFGTPFDADRSLENRDFVIKTFDEAWKKRDSASSGGYASNMPIFILGMPRSGTSLTEQILGAHSQVNPAGELQAFSKMVRASHNEGREQVAKEGRFEIIENGVDGNQSPIIPQDFEPATLEQIGKGYVDYVRELAGDLPHVTDKMPYNFLFAPLIHMSLPGAKIIHTRRNPIDTCLSCYFQNFSGGSEYSFDLEDLAVYYNNYLAMMDHWRDELKLPMLEIDYEELVSDTESTVRKMLEFCELDFEQQCLASHKNKRIVATASYQQVRQPIYTKSVERWKPYEKHLGPLLERLAVSD